MAERDTKLVEVEVKVHVNGFPKSGTHAIDGMVGRIFGFKHHRHWLGSFAGHSFTDQWLELDNIIERMGAFDHSINLKGHMGHKPEIAEAFRKNKFCNVFIFRDFRDVAVSIAHHLRDDDLPAPAKDVVSELDFDEALELAIVGGGVYAPLMARWEYYTPWLEEPHVMRVCYGDLILEPEKWADLLVRFLYGRTAAYHGIENVELERKEFDETVQIALDGFQDKGSSATYRKGKLDKWKDYFTPRHKQLFKDNDPNNWLVKLGFEEDDEW